MRLIAIEGNIGVGKSTLLPKLAEAIGYKQLQEPVDDPTFDRLLKGFTENPNDTKARLKFQRYITKTRYEQLQDLPDGNYIIERSLYSDLVFSQVNMLSMERPTGEYLSYYYDIIALMDTYPKIDAVVYLKADPSTSYKRMLGRGRAAEAGTPLSYIEDLEAYHQAALPQICRQFDTPLVEMYWDWNPSVQTLVTELIKKEIV